MSRGLYIVVYLPFTVNPDIILGTETWLDSNTSSYEYFPTSKYNIYRYGRPPRRTMKVVGEY